jgi:hypothetical protein
MGVNGGARCNDDEQPKRRPDFPPHQRNDGRKQDGLDDPDGCKGGRCWPLQLSLDVACRWMVVATEGLGGISLVSQYHRESVLAGAAAPRGFTIRLDGGRANDREASRPRAPDFE